MSDEQPDIVKLHVTASLQNFTEALSDAEELAWDHAQMAANSAGFSIGSEQFEYIYKHLSKQYKDERSSSNQVSTQHTNHNA